MGQYFLHKLENKIDYTEAAKIREQLVVIESLPEKLCCKEINNNLLGSVDSLNGISGKYAVMHITETSFNVDNSTGNLISEWAAKNSISDYM